MRGALLLRALARDAAPGAADFWVRIPTMRSTELQRGGHHPSYKLHRRQVRTQILLPVLIGAFAFFVAPIAAWVAASGGSGDVGRWAAISTMWLLIPAMIAGMVLLVVLILLIYLTGMITGRIPRYSYQAQSIAARVAGGTQRATAMIRKPVLAFRALGSTAKAALRRLRERG